MAEEARDLRTVTKVNLCELLPTVREWRRAVPTMFRGTGVGFLIGLVPGPAAVLSTFVSYTVERRIARRKDEIGRGTVEGVAGPESANNAATAGAMVPLLALGIPFAPATAMLLGALMIHGVQPGPLLMEQRPGVFWGVVASMYVGNVMLLVLNLPLVGVFANLLRTPKHLLTALIVLLCLVGTYSVNNSALDLAVLIAMGVLGYVLLKLHFDLALLVLALVLGPMMERTFRQSMILAQGNPVILLERPLTAGLLAVGLIVVALPPLLTKLCKRAKPLPAGQVL